MIEVNDYFLRIAYVFDLVIDFSRTVVNLDTNVNLLFSFLNFPNSKKKFTYLYNLRQKSLREV